MACAGDPPSRDRQHHVRRLLRQAWIAARDWAHVGHTYARAHLRRLRRPPIHEPAPAGACGKAPVVLLPGILEPWSYLAPLGRALAGHGHPVHYVETLGWNIAGLEASVERCLRVLAERGITGAVLVAHSKGGLIGKAVLMDARAAGAVVGLVAIATPFRGSTVGGPLQRLRPVRRSPLGLFTPDGEQLAALTAEEAVNARIVSMAPAWDQMIPNGSHLDGATNVTLGVAGHFRPVQDPAVWDLVHTWVHHLSSPPVADPG